MSLTKEAFIHSDMVDGKVQLCVHLSDMGCDDDIDAAIKEWGTNAEETFIQLTFHPSEVLNHAIEMHCMPSLDNAIDITAKPLFDALRNDLEEMITKIDALQFKEGISA